MSAPYDEPTASALVVAVREFLEHDVLSATEGRLRFHTRVAVNALRIVERELRLAPEHAEEHARRLDRLGVRDDEDLVSRIRIRALAAADPGLRSALTDLVRDKLQVDNPAYPDVEKT